MSETPERDIERQLRQHAQARRAAAGEPSLHPATRRLLHAEARRQWGGRAGGRSKAGWWERFGPRLAFALGMLALLGVAASLLFNLGGNSSLNLAQLDGGGSAMSAALPRAADEAFARAESARSELLDDRGRSGGGPARSLAPAPAAAPRSFSAVETLAGRTAAPVAEAQFFGGTLADAGADRATDGEALNVAAVAAPSSMSVGFSRPAASPVAFAGEAVLGVTQVFRNVAVAGGAKAGATAGLPVLNNFTVAQTGNDLTVVDEDGSVYRGNVVPLVAVEEKVTAEPDLAARGLGRDGAVEARRTRAASAPATVSALVGTRVEPSGGAAQNWQFQVEGTNLSLRQRVVFNGQFYQNAPAAFASNALNFQRQVSASAENNPAAQAVAPNSFSHFIQGRVQVGSQRETELNAIPVEP